jgi:hypothetical protein
VCGMKNLLPLRKANWGAPWVDGHHLLESSSAMAWLEVAARLPGRSMHLAVVLLRLARIEQTDRIVLSNRVCRRFGLDRNAKYRALLSLEGAGLIRVQRKLGRSPIVLIVGGSAEP